MPDHQETDLAARLHALAVADQERAASPGVRTRVMTTWDARANGVSTPPHMSLRVWLPVAVSLAMVVGLLVGSIAQQRSSPQRATGSPSIAGADSAMLVAPGADLLPRFDHGEFVPIEIATPNGSIQADVLIGQDGLPRAIRVSQ